MLVAVKSVTPLTTRWYRDNDLIDTVDGSRDGVVLLHIDDATAGHNGVYRAVVTNAAGSVTSRDCVVVVDAAPQLVQDLPSAVHIVEGEPLELTFAGTSRLVAVEGFAHAPTFLPLGCLFGLLADHWVRVFVTVCLCGCVRMHRCVSMMFVLLCRQLRRGPLRKRSGTSMTTLSPKRRWRAARRRTAWTSQQHSPRVDTAAW